MIRILFICLGNICRSPMAEFIMRDIVAKAGLSEKFEIASAATSAWEIGTRSIRLQGRSWKSTAYPAPERPPGK